MASIIKVLEYDISTVDTFKVQTDMQSLERSGFFSSRKIKNFQVTSSDNKCVVFVVYDRVSHWGAIITFFIIVILAIIFIPGL